MCLASSTEINSEDFLSFLTLQRAALIERLKANAQFYWLIIAVCIAESDNHDNILSAVVILVEVLPNKYVAFVVCYSKDLTKVTCLQILFI